MSHKATNWAIQQRGLMPATKLVLWYLCDRYTPDFGCYPSQDQLAADAEISRASLNTHIRKLEQSGLIHRQRRAKQGTKQRKSTRYLLGFESDFPLKPCPDSGHELSKKETTTARSKHASTHDAQASGGPEAACLAACGEGLCPDARSVIQATAPVIDHWLATGYDLDTDTDTDTDILPVLQARTSRKRDDPIRTWAYFTPAVAKRHAQRMALAERAKSAGETKPVPTLTAFDILLRTAEWINSGRYVPPSAVPNVTRDALLRAGLVTEATLCARQIY